MRAPTSFVMPAHPGPREARPECKLVAGIHVFLVFSKQVVDGGDKRAFTPVFDGLCPAMTTAVEDLIMWRPMLPTDVAAAHALSDIVHPGYPEDRAVFEERLRLYPAGCYVLASGDGLNGYALSHPYVKDSAPALNTLLGALPDTCDTYYIHDVALLPDARQTGAASAIVALLKAQARKAGFDAICLIAVNNSAPFWERHGFVAREAEGMRGRLESYGDGAVYMHCGER